MVGANNGEGDLARNFLGLCESLLILIVIGGRLENMNLVECDIGKNLKGLSGSRRWLSGGDSHPRLELRNFLLGHCISFGNHRYQIDFGMKPAHELNIELLQTIQYSVSESDIPKKNNLRVARWLDEI